jgi:hypothetical protein
MTMNPESRGEKTFTSDEKRGYGRGPDQSLGPWFRFYRYGKSLFALLYSKKWPKNKNQTNAILSRVHGVANGPYNLGFASGGNIQLIGVQIADNHLQKMNCVL